MRRGIILTFMVLLTLVLLLLAGAGIFLATFNPNDYKDDIREAFYKATGKQILLQGDMEATLYPWLGLKTGKFTVSDPPAFGAEPFLSVENASLRVALLPLFSKRLEIEEILLDGLRLKLVETVTGQKNWELGKTPSTASLAQGAPEGAGAETAMESVPLQDESARSGATQEQSGPPMEISMRSLQCNDLEVVYRNMSEGATYRLNVESLKLVDLNWDTDMPLSVSGAFVDEGGDLKSSFSLSAMVRLSGDGQLLAFIRNLDVRADKGGLDMHLELEALVKGNPSETLVGNIKKLAIQAGTGTAGLSASLSTPFLFDSTAMSLNLDNVQALLNDSKLTGKLSLVLPGGTPSTLRVEGKLDADRLDMDKLLASLDQLNAALKKTGTAAGGGAPNMGNDRVAGSSGQKPPQRVEKGEDAMDAALRNLGADLNLSVGSLIVSKMNLSAFTAHVQADKGKVRVPYSFALFRGNISGTATADIGQKTPPVSLSSTIKGLAVGDAMQAFSGKSDISGTLSASLDVKGQGLDWAALAPGLNGKGKVSIVNGEVKGFHLIPQGLPNIPAVPVNFPLRSLSGSFTINKGVLNTRDIVLDSPLMSASGGGDLNLASQTLLMNIKFLVAGQPPSIPLVISGPVSDPSYTVNMQELLKSTVQDVLKSPEHVREILKDPVQILEKPEQAKELIRGVEGLIKKKK